MCSFGSISWIYASLLKELNQSHFIGVAISPLSKGQIISIPLRLLQSRHTPVACFQSWTTFSVEGKGGKHEDPKTRSSSVVSRLILTSECQREPCVFFWLLLTPTTRPAWPPVLGEGASIHDSAANSWWSEVIILAHGRKRSHKNGAHSNHPLLRSVWAGAWAGDCISGRKHQLNGVCVAYLSST